ncbi:MAG: hypothetical protein IKN17_09190 [Ruminococcus sp.]|nr:hypothetical protein [Ruminococcus sp.]
MRKSTYAAIGAAITAALAILMLLIFSGKNETVHTVIVTESGTDVSEAAVSAAPESTVQSEPQSAAQSESSAADSTAKEYKQYSFRSKKLFDSHYQKHGSEFGSITQEEYLKLANDLLNSDSDTILHKTEKEDGDDVYFDTATGYFLVLSTDGYIRTFFIPDKGIEYYNKQ